MHVQAHISGHISGKIPNHAGSGLSAAQQNGNPMLSQTQSLGGSWNTWKMDPDLPLARKHIQERISHLLQRQQISQSYEMQQRLPDVVRRLEEGLFREASSKDEYMNTESLEHRLQTVVRRIPSNNHNQHQQLPHHMSSSSSIGTMIPTPGIAHNGSMNSIIPSSGDNSMVSSTMAPNTVNTGLLAADGFNGVNGGSFGASDGSLANDYQQSPANIPIGSGGSMLSSMSDPRVLTQMIPTPGLSSSHSMPMISDASSEGGFSTVESAMASEQQQMKNYGASQNSRILQSLSGQMGIGMRSNLQQKASSYGFTNGQMNGGLQMTGNNIHLTNRSTASEAYLNVSAYGNSSKFLQKHFDQRHQQQTMQTSPNKMIPLAADMYGMNASDLSSSGNLYGSDAYVGSGVNNHNLNPVSLQSKSKPNSGMLAHQPNSQNIQQSAHTKPQVIDQFTKMNFQSHYSTREQLMQSQQQMQKFQQQQIQQPQHAQFAQQKQQNHHDQQQLLKNDILRQSQQVSNVNCQILPEHGMISRNEVLQAQNTDQYHLSELQNHYQLQNTAAEDHFKGAQTLCHSSGPQDFHAESLQTSQQMQQQQMGHHQIVESQDGFNCFSDGPQSEALLEDMWHPQQVDKVQNIQPDLSSNDRHVQEEFHQRITGQDEAQRPHLSVEESGTSWTVAPKGAPVQQASRAVASRPVNLTREQEYRKQQRWLLFLFHARRCSAPEGKCEEVHCITVQKLWIHMKKCNGHQCWYPRCRESNILIGHLRNCKVAKCPVCAPVHHFWSQHKVQCHPPSATRDVPVSANDSWRSVDAGEASAVSTKTGAQIAGKPEELQSSVKRLKMDHPSPSHIRKSDNSLMPVAFMNHPHPQEAQPHLQVFKQIEAPVSVKYEVMEMKTEHHSVFGNTSSPAFTDVKKDNLDSVHAVNSDTGPTLPSKLPSHANQETVLVEEIVRCKVEVKQETTARPADPVAGTKSGKPMIKGVSLTELFTPEQIREHIKGLRQWVGKSKAKAEKNQAMEHSMSENSCQLCAVEKLAFEPPPIYCTPCGARIKRNATYYTVGTGDTRHYFCIPCYNEVRGDSIEVDRTAIPKGRLEKKRNDEETEEWWVQCDKCEAWQHQICALFNGRRNDGGQAEYTCPNCCITEIERGERKPLPQSAVLGAKDLPRTILSDHIEQRLAKRLKQERQERAKVQGKSIDEVPGAEALVIRVVSSVDKKLEVKQQFLEIFQEENYPAEFPYKSKVILLFQKIEGVEVCLFGMYVQEFGAECQFPNQRRVYLSYLDSVKYFRPEIKTVFGEALRTFVYHEILIGYLEYCKKRGFTSCYIWACPPLKGEDYILYCHPEIQKTPKSDKLREWYLAMLRKAVKENIVVDLTNLYDHFFAQVGECKAKVTAARLPYFDGDYWPGAAEDLISQFRLEEDGRKLQKKGKTKMTISKRALKAAGQGDLSANASKDALLMQKLGETIHPMKEDFIMVHLQHACTHCCHLMVSGKRWVCGRCKNFQLCDKCHEAEQRLEERARHPITSREKHSLTPVEINGVAADTKDRDEILESEFFDTRQAFLSLCQGNHYQYDTLRRAKHSSMMVLYHLHNPTAPAFVTTCNNCLHDIEAGQGWRCEVCPDFDVCDSCYQKDGGVDHPHKLTNHPSTAERDAQNKEARQKRVLQLRKMLDLLVHASQCRFPHCKYPNCRQVKGLFRHGMQCRTRASGGCLLCKKMWYLLQLHARACKESECLVPRCKDLKEHMRRLQQQSDSRRRAAVMEMMRQRAAEVAGSTG